MFLQSSPDSFSMKGVWAPLPEKTVQGGHNQLQQIVVKRCDYIAHTNGKRTFPWRIFTIAELDRELLDNDLVYLLATPSVLKDISWISMVRSLGIGGTIGISPKWIFEQELIMRHTNIILILLLKIRLSM